VQPQDVKIMVNNYAGTYESRSRILTDKAERLYRIVMAEVLPEEDKRHAIMKYLFGKERCSELTDGRKHGVLEFLQLVRVGDKYIPNHIRVQALRSCFRESLIEDGQQELPL
jgi:hypothetical protein